ncbi:hypothetical protein PTI98_000167 [Pleurotus ostreatus]|nr:hypothetical protein PTI98_000167 [Pleurotus ostreatus]
MVWLRLPLLLRVDRVLFLLLLQLCICICGCAPSRFVLVGAILVNVTIDDTFGDQFYTLFPQYTHPFLPPNQHDRYPKYIPNTNTVPPVWKQGPACTTCGVKLDQEQVMSGTWYDGRWDEHSKEQTRVEFTFWGTAIYIYSIVSNRLTDLQNYEFYIDNPNLPVGNFTYSADGSNSYIYHYLLYSNTDLQDGQHTFTLASSKPDDGSVNGILMLVLFDYAVYTLDIDIDTPSSSTQQHYPTRTSRASATTTAPLSTVHLYQALSGLLGGIAAISVGVCMYSLRHKFTEA